MLTIIFTAGVQVRAKKDRSQWPVSGLANRGDLSPRAGGGEFFFVLFFVAVCLLYKYN